MDLQAFFGRNKNILCRFPKLSPQKCQKIPYPIGLMLNYSDEMFGKNLNTLAYNSLVGFLKRFVSFHFECYENHDKSINKL